MSRMRISGSLRDAEEDSRVVRHEGPGPGFSTGELDIRKKCRMFRNRSRRKTVPREHPRTDTDDEMEEFGGTRLIAGYVAVDRVPDRGDRNLDLHRKRSASAEPAIGGFYTSTSDCLGNTFKLAAVGSVRRPERRRRPGSCASSRTPDGTATAPAAVPPLSLDSAAKARPPASRARSDRSR